MEITGYLGNKNNIVNIKIKSGEVDSITPRPSHMEDGSDLPWVIPGLIDLQVNGFSGYDLNAAQCDVQLVKKVIESIWSSGVTHCCPTLITGSHEKILHGMKVINEACQSDRMVNESILGIHLEGPYISREDGPRGAHPLQWVRQPDREEFKKWQDAAGGKICMVTLAPELPGALSFIEWLVKKDVIVSIGHTAASSKQIYDAIAAGAEMSTHLGNGAHPRLPRHPNYIWEQLAADELWACFIADAHHLPMTVLKSMLRAKMGKSILVSDAVHLAGLPPGIYETPIGGKVELLSNGRLQLAENPEILAGSASTLLCGIQNVVQHCGIEWKAAVDMATLNPAVALKRPDVGKLEDGSKANLVLVKEIAGKLTVLQTFINGDLVYFNS